MTLSYSDIAICSGSDESTFFVTMKSLQVSPKFRNVKKAEQWMSEFIARAKKEGMLND